VAACALCGGRRWDTLETAGPAAVVRCACGLVFVTPQPPPADLEAAYDAAYYRPWADQAPRRAAIWQARLARVAALRPPPARLLDVGCGTGAFLGLCRERGFEVAGTELSAYAAKTAAQAGFAVTRGELWDAGLPAAAFDVVTCWHVIEHTTDPRRTLAEMRRVLRPGGTLVLATPNLANHIFRWAYLVARRRRLPLYEPDEREQHLYHFSEATLRRLVAGAGLEVVEVGFDRGAAALVGPRLVNAVAYAWYRLTGLNWGIALELCARAPAAGVAG
jgi:2-polyprenyl-3-methyl-5-hydroxy-6-metoxy-1,4-benzoquinol methylase